jgi:hypothetical protein
VPAQAPCLTLQYPDLAVRPLDNAIRRQRLRGLGYPYRVSLIAEPTNQLTTVWLRSLDLNYNDITLPGESSA